MRDLLTIFSGLLSLLVAGPGVASAAGAMERMPTPPAAERLLSAIDSGASQDELARLAPVGSPVREAFEAGDTDRAKRMLLFRPLKEAPIPEGFPAFTPVGLIEVKQYPAYRKAAGKGFWVLFQHIQKQGIPMTAPVEMPGGRQSGRDASMAFLYQNTGVGDPGPIDGVQVVDTPAMTVVSLGGQNYSGRAAVADARRRLEAWAAASPDYRTASVDEPFRLMGYNSPMVQGDDRYWEAQLQVERRETGAPGVRD